MIQAGERGRGTRLFEASNTITVPAGPGGDAEGLTLFRDHVRPGDLVVTADGPLGQLVIGEVIGDADETADAPAGPQSVRPVEWWGRYGRSDRSILSPSLEAATRLEHLVHELTPSDAWLAFAARVRERPPVAAVDPPPAKVATAAAAVKAAKEPRAPRAPRAPRVPKAAPAPKPLPQVYRKCPECMMQKVPAQFRAGSEHCIDCRERLGED